MKNILLSSIITTLLLIACGNSTPKEKNNPQEKRDSIASKLTPQEIEYYRSVRDKPLTYTLMEEYWGFEDINHPEEIIIYRDSLPLFFIDQTTAYLKAYDALCGALMTIVASRYRIDTNFSEDLYYKCRIYLLNREGKDIIPIIDFPDRKLKEDSIWNNVINHLINVQIVGALDMYKQPIIKPGETMIVEVSSVIP